MYFSVSPIPWRSLLGFVGRRLFSQSTAVLYGKRGPTDLKGRSTTAQAWIVRQMNDPYVRRAHEESYRCRSAFKLLEMDDKYGFLSPGAVVLDCGAAPGSWSQVAVERVNALGVKPKQPKGRVISIDVQHMLPVIGATVLCNSDFTNPKIQQEILMLLGDNRADVILSDMAPSATGIKSLDQPQIMKLAYAALRFSLVALSEGGTFLVKLLQSELIQGYESALKKCFTDLRIVKPHASRIDSAEMFIIAREFHLGKKAADNPR